MASRGGAWNGEEGSGEWVARRGRGRGERGSYGKGKRRRSGELHNVHLGSPGMCASGLGTSGCYDM